LGDFARSFRRNDSRPALGQPVDFADIILSGRKGRFPEGKDDRLSLHDAFLKERTMVFRP